MFLPLDLLIFVRDQSTGAEYTITYYPKQYTSVEEIKADTDPDVKPTVWVIQTTKRSDGSYYASLKDECIVPNSNSAGAVFGKTHVGNYIIPLGTITVEETKAPAGFTKDGAVVSSAKTGATISGTNNVYLFQFVDENSAVYLKSGNALSTSLEDETAVTLTYAERQINGTPKMEKHDLELNKKAAMGGTNFDGITFEVYCLDDSVIIGNTTYKKGVEAYRLFCWKQPNAAKMPPAPTRQFVPSFQSGSLHPIQKRFRPHPAERCPA